MTRTKASMKALVPDLAMVPRWRIISSRAFCLSDRMKISGAAAESHEVKGCFGGSIPCKGLQSSPNRAPRKGAINCCRVEESWTP